MTQATSFSWDDIDRLVDEKLKEKTINRAKFYAKEELLWTALAPSWTVPLAEKSGFPVPNVESFLEDLREKSIVKVTEVRSGTGDQPGDRLYSMDEVMRGDVMDTYGEEPEQFPAIQPMLTRIGKQILSAIDDRVSDPPTFAPPALMRWALLAANASSPLGIVNEFDAQVEEAFSDKASATIRDWMNAARIFSTMLLRSGNDSMKQALQRASQRLILLRREENDQRHLKDFYQRDEQLAAFTELMSSDDKQWAIHFLGAGGVGKTMLVRKITVDWAKDHESIAARVDFDYLKADYPILDPGMLLWAFAQDLRAYANSDAIRLFNRADRKFQELSQRLRSEFRDASPRRATEFPEFREAISQYGEALRKLPERVVLIVDTCEELAKIGIGRTPIENIDETFRILRALHDGEHTLEDEDAPPSGGVPNLRVIFSGRRPLSRAGVDWRCPSASRLKPRNFLRLHEVRGFTRTDAAKFLREKMQTPSDLIPPIILRSTPDTGSVADIDWDDPKRAPSNEKRCNPFYLKLYAKWAKEEPRPTAQEILDTPPATQYVELRVIRRLHVDSLREILPVVALLGHFNRSALQEILQDVKLKDPVDTIFDLLQDEEWINQRREQDSAAGANLILDVEPGLRTPLFVYFKNDQMLAEVQPRAADYFEKITLEGDPNLLDWSTFDAAITVLDCDQDKSRVFRWWKKVEERMSQLRPAFWFRDVTDKLQNEDGAAALRDPQAPPHTPPESRLRPAVLASNATARLRASNREELNVTWRDLSRIWGEVLTKAPAVSEEMPDLELRALASFISVNLRLETSEATQAQVRRLWQLVEKSWSIDANLRGDLLAAAEALVESLEASAERDASRIEQFLKHGKQSDSVITDLVGTLSSEYSGGAGAPSKSFLAFANSVAARAELLLNNREKAQELFLKSLQVEYSDGEQPREAHWFQPEDVPSRVRLEFVRAAYPALMSPKETREIIGHPPVKLEFIDNERLHSALLALRHTEHPIPSEDLEKYEGLAAPNGLILYSQTQTERSPQSVNWKPEALVCRAHHVIPPLYVTVGQVLASQGRADEVLSDLAAVAQSRSESYKALLDIDRVCSRVTLRMRLREVYEKGGQVLKSSPDTSDLTLVWALDAHDGTPQLILELPDELKQLSIRPTQTESTAVTKLNETMRMTGLSAGFTSQQREKLRWLHAIWQTLREENDKRILMALKWAENNFYSVLSWDFERFPLFELASLQLDCLEALRLAAKHEQVLDLGGFTRRSFDPELFYKQSTLLPEEALTLAMRASVLAERPVSSLPVWPEWLLNRVGMRRAAEIAIHEGDLLSLRLPKSAAYLYRYAASLFARCGDSIGNFVAITSEAMMLPHRELGTLAESAADCYSLVRERLKGETKLPLTDTLLGLVDNPVSESGSWAPRTWRPRLVRYMLLLTVSRFKENRAEVGTKIIRLLLPGAVLDTKESEFQTTADLTRWMQDAYAPPSILRRIWKVSFNIGKGLLGLAFIIFFVNLVFRGFSWLFQIVVPDFAARSEGVRLATFALVVTTVSLSIRLMIKVRRKPKSDKTAPIWSTEYPAWRIWVDFVVIWGLLAIIGWLHFQAAIEAVSLTRIVIGGVAVILGSLLFVFRGRLSRVGHWFEELLLQSGSSVLTQWTRLELFVRPHAGSITVNRPVTDMPELAITLQRQFRGLDFLRPLFEKLERGTADLSPPALSALQPYGELYEVLWPAAFRDVFDFLRSRLRKHPMDFEVDLPEGNVNGLCWESAVVARHKSNELLYNYLPFNCYRKISLSRTHVRSRPRKAMVVALAEGDVAQALARNAWEFPERSVRGIDVEIQHGNEIFSRDFRPEVSIVHLIGSLESSYLGVGMRFGEERFKLHSQASESMHQLDNLTRPEDLVRSFPGLSVCIIQEEPRELATERTAEDRRAAFLARLFASELYVAGIPFVLVVPPLRVTEAIEAMRELGEVLTRRSWSKSRLLLNAISELRLKIGRYTLDAQADPAIVEELPQDLCLYFNRDWDGLLT